MHLPRFHFRPAKNWMNDPNGLCQVNGWYHMFYQYNPHGSKWGDMHWGHARSRDLVRWEELPIAMAPAEARGEIHCFSGGCCKDAQGKPYFFYTSIGPEEIGRDCKDGAQQWTAEPTDDDLTRLVQTEQYAITDDVHGGQHVREWRDPCVIFHQGQYLMTLGGCLNGHGCVLLYTSPDMKKWMFRHVLAQSAEADDMPWECPNFFELDGRFVLFYSPCGPVMVQVGTLDEGLHFHCEYEEVLDPAGWQGYYAPQAFRDEAGRTLLFGWMPECDGGRDKGWSGVMSLPRELHVENGRLWAYPADSVDSLAEWSEVQVSPGETCLMQDGRHAMLRFAWNTATPVTLRLFAGAEGETLLQLDPCGEMRLIREHSCKEEGVDRSAIVRKVELGTDAAEVFLALDGSVIECAVNGQWLSGRVYPQENCAAVYMETQRAMTVRTGSVK